jgi:uncharacterized membrane protein YkoI
MKRNKMIVIIIAAVLIAGIGFGAGMMVKSSVASGASLSADDARQIALSSVGVSADKATFTKEVLDEGVYEIDFYTESNEYDFEIDADTGAIVDREVSPRELSLPADDGQQEGNSDALTESSGKATQPATESTMQNNANDGDVIGVAAAKEIALDHAGLSSASFSKAHLDYDDGIRVYDIEFVAGDREYDYEINAYTGPIIEYDTERMDYDDDHDD